MAKSKISASYDNSAPFYRKLITVPPPTVVILHQINACGKDKPQNEVTLNSLTLNIFELR